MRFLMKFIWALVLVVSGCVFTGSPGHIKKLSSESNLRFVFITTCAESKFFEPLKKGMNDAADMLGVHCSFMGTKGVDIKAQVNMVHQAIESGYDGIALNIIDPAAFDAVVQEAMDHDIPVVAFNVDDHATANARLSAVCQQLYQAGRTLGKRALTYIPKSSHVLITMHDKGVSALQDRVRGICDVLKTKNITWTVMVTGTSAEKSAAAITSKLKADPDIRHILCTGQADTEGAGLAVKESFTGYTVAGFDMSTGTLDMIKEGIIGFTIDQQPYVQGFYPVIQLTQYCRFGIVPANMDAGAGIIDKDNVDQVIELCKMGYR